MSRVRSSGMSTTCTTSLIERCNVSRKLTHASWFLASLVAVAATFDDLLTADRVPAYRDLLHIVLPVRRYLAEHLRRGELPLWNPLSYMGAPFLANFQSGVLYPPSMLLLLPWPLGADLFLFAHYVIALSGMWIWLRGRGLAPASAAVGSLVFTLSGYLVSAMSVTPLLEGAAWAPWVLHSWERFADRRAPLPGLGFVAVLCLQILAGSPENLLLTLVLLITWELRSLFARPEEVGRRGVLLLGSVVLAAGICAIQLVPTLEYARHSARAGALPYTEVTTWSLRPVSLLQLLFPHTSVSVPHGEQRLGPAFEARLTFFQSIYLGIVPLALAAAGLAAGRNRAFWAIVLMGSVILALGSYTPIFGWFHRLIPFLLARFRYPEKFLFVTTFATAFLAADGTEAVLRRRASARRAALAASATLVATALGLILLSAADPEKYLRTVAILCGENRPLWQFAPLASDLTSKAGRLVLLLSAFVALLVSRRWLGDGTLRMLLVAVVAVDLFCAHRRLNLNVDWSEVQNTPVLIDAPALRDSHGRVFHYQTSASAAATPVVGLARWTPKLTTGEDLHTFYRDLWSALPFDAGMFFGVGNVSGGDAIAPASDKLLLSALAELPRPRAVELLRLCRTRYLIGPMPLDVPGLERVLPSPPSRFFVYRIPALRPVVRLVSRLRPITSDRDAVVAITDPGFDADKEAVVEHLPPGWRDGTGMGAAQLVSYDDRRVEIRLRSDAEAFLTLDDSFYPGWRAAIDGARTTIYRTNVFFRGVVVPPGQHTVEFRYRPRSFYVGTFLSVLSLALLAPFALLWFSGRGS